MTIRHRFLLLLAAALPLFGQPRSEERQFAFNGGSVATTITFPDAPLFVPPPVVIVCPGSGPVSPHVRAKVARPLLEAGFAVVSYINPGFAPSTGQEIDDLETLAEIPIAAERWLKSSDLPVDKNNVGLMGVSNGGWVAQIAATRDRDFRFLVLQSGPAVSPLLQMEYAVKNRDIAEHRGEKVASTASRLRTATWTYLATGKGKRAAERAIAEIHSNPDLAYMTTEMPPLPPNLSPEEIAKPRYAFYRTSTLDPMRYLPKIEQATFAAYGANDLFVNAAESANLLLQLKQRRPSWDLTVHIYPNAGHGLEKRLVSDPMHDPQSPTVEAFINDLTAWMKSVADKPRPADNRSADDSMASCPLHAQHMAQQKAAQSDMTDCPLHAEHAQSSSADATPEHANAVNDRHDTLGVSHESVEHAFRLFDDGAAIELRAKSDRDTETIEAIRKHMQLIAKQFRANDFSTPMFVHGKEPDGIDSLRSLHDRLEFRYEPLPSGARVRMTTSDASALAALHAFMRFQIIEHHTADNGNVESDSKR